MPGLIGFTADIDTEQAGRLLNRMAQALEPGDIYQKNLEYGPGFGLGRISLGIVNPQPQPVWSEDGCTCLVLEGELYNSQPLRQDLIQRGFALNGDGDAELVLKMFEQYGEGFPNQLNGQYIVAIWNFTERKLLVINDRLGLYPLYYAKANGKFLFASGVRALLADPELPRQVNRLGIAQFLTFDHLLGDNTLLSAVQLLPQGSVLSIQEGKLRIQPYASLYYPERYPLRSETEYQDELLETFRQAVKRQAMDDIPKGVLLSGGLDSRATLAVLNELPSSWPLYSFTWGIPGCDDARYAKEIAAQTRAEHHFFPLQPDFLLRTAEESVRITDGQGNIVNLHALATLDEETPYSKVIYKGFLGDAMFGFALRHQLWADYDEDTSIQAHFQVHTDQGVISFHPEEQKKLFTPDFQNQVGSGVMESYRSGMLASGSHQLAQQRLYFDYTQRVPRMTLHGIEVMRSKAHIRLPYSDSDIVEFSRRVPPGLLYNRRLFQDAFVRAYPKMSSIPVSWTGYPMRMNARAVGMRARQVIQWHLHARGLSKVQELKWRPYKDYHNWFRKELRSWLESILLSNRFLERGYYNPDYVRRLVSAHMAGENQTVRLGAMLSIEIWHRLFLD